MGFKYNSVVRFNANTDVGLDRVALGSIVQVDDAGTQKLFLYEDATGVTNTTTIATAISGGNLVERVDTETLATELATRHPLTTVDAVPTDGSNNLVTSNGVYDAILAGAGAQGSLKAWVRFYGAGSTAPQASFNVTSVSDNGVGDYTMNFTNALVDNLYAAVGMAGDDSFNTSMAIISTSSSAVRVRTGMEDGEGTKRDSIETCIAVFR